MTARSIYSSLRRLAVKTLEKHGIRRLGKAKIAVKLVSFSDLARDKAYFVTARVALPNLNWYKAKDEFYRLAKERFGVKAYLEPKGASVVG